MSANALNRTDFAAVASRLRDLLVFVVQAIFNPVFCALDRFLHQRDVLHGQLNQKLPETSASDQGNLLDREYPLNGSPGFRPRVALQLYVRVFNPEFRHALDLLTDLAQLSQKLTLVCRELFIAAGKEILSRAASSWLRSDDELVGVENGLNGIIGH